MTLDEAIEYEEDLACFSLGICKDREVEREHRQLAEWLKDYKRLLGVEKTGHWIYIKNSDVNGLKIVKCDKCHKRAYGSTKFCPNCGARMVESEEV